MKKTTSLLLIALPMIVLTIASCGSKTQEETTTEVTAEVPAETEPVVEAAPVTSTDTMTTASGLMYIITQTGNGEMPQPGQNVTVHYTGTLLDGSKFDSSVDRGQPLSFVLGVGQVIKGWDEGIALLSKGGKARLIIPHQLGYGESGRPPMIPPAATLVFDVELIDFK